MATPTGPATRLVDLHLVAIVVVRSDASLGDVARTMVRTGGSAVVIAGRDAIVTERDLVGALARGCAPDDQAADFASRHPWSIRSTETVMDALAAMVRHGVRHLIVANGDGDPVGIVGVTDVAEVVFGETQLPQWLTAFRLALRGDEHTRTSEP